MGDSPGSAVRRAAEEISQETDLTLIVETADEVIMGSDPRLEGPINPDELEDEDLATEEEA